jgi:hypothetical protein
LKIVDSGLAPLLILCGFSLFPLFLAENNFPQLAEFINSIFRVSYLSPPFADLRTIVIGIGCKDVHAVGDLITCDTRTTALMVWNYPSVLLRLRFLYPELSNFMLLFFIISLFMIFLVYRLAKKQNCSQNLLLSIFLISPPFLLCINRMNFDLFILVFIWLGANLLMTNATKTQLPATVLFIFSGVLKFYGFASLIFILLIQKGKLRLYGFVALVIGFLLVLKDLPLLKNAVGKDIYGSIGLPVLSSLLNGKNSAEISLLSGGFLLVTLIIIGVSVYLIKNNLVFRVSENLDLVPLITGFVFLFTWFSSSNYYYRLILTFPVLLTLIKKPTNEFEKIIFGSTVSSFFLSPKIFGPLQNLLVLPLVIYLLSVFYLLLLSKYRLTVNQFKQL